MARQGPVLGQVNVRLPVLDAHPHRQGLGLQGHPGGVEHLEGVPGAVAQGQRHVVRRQAAGALRPLYIQGTDPVPLQRQTRQAAAEADVAAQLQELPPEAGQGAAQVVRAHVGLGVPEDGLRRAVGGQGLQNEPMAHVPGAGVQLAVGEGPRAPLAELDIGRGVQRPGGPEPLYVLLPPLHIPPPLQQDGRCAAPGQGQGAEEAPGPRAHHHGPGPGGGDGGGQPVDRLRGWEYAPVPPAAEDLVLVLHRRLEGVDKPHPLPGVDGFAEDPYFPDLRRRDPQGRRRLPGKEGLVLLQGQLDVLNLQHLVTAVSVFI